jgi:hypothetical protein
MNRQLDRDSGVSIRAPCFLAAAAWHLHQKLAKFSSSVVLRLAKSQFLAEFAVFLRRLEAGAESDGCFNHLAAFEQVCMVKVSVSEKGLMTLVGHNVE